MTNVLCRNNNRTDEIHLHSGSRALTLEPNHRKSDGGKAALFICKLPIYYSYANKISSLITPEEQWKH